MSNVLASHSRLLAKLSAEVGLLGDIKFLLAEFWRYYSELQNSEGRWRRMVPSLPFSIVKTTNPVTGDEIEQGVVFANGEERAEYMEAKRRAYQQRAYEASLRENINSLREQLAMMTDGLTIEEITQFLRQLEEG